ncbi:peroxisomal biogenesis factor 11 [Chytridium lagenaria]|nr:peroxisomal biogenesis factor 11 [Chytridium lagenaria]
MVGPSYLRLMVLRKILTLNDGRDKVLKCVQYGSKAALYLNLLEGKEDGVAPIVPRMEKLVSHMSMTRKIIRLAHFLEPLDTLKTFLSDLDQLALVIPGLSSRTKQTPTFTERMLAFGTLLGAIVGIANDLSDDAICLAKMGVLDKSWIKPCTPLSDRLWFASIFIDAHEVLQDVIMLTAKRERLKRAKSNLTPNEKMENENHLLMHRISLAKMSADFIFCTIDVFQLGEKGWDDGWQVFTGLAAAILGTTKLYIKNSK